MSPFYKCIEKDIDEFSYLYNFFQNHINSTQDYISENFNIETIGKHTSSLYHSV